MKDDSINTLTRKDLTIVMKSLKIEINGIIIPLLNEGISQITIDVNNGEVAKIRPIYILTK